jgi:Cytochrome oxidase complex assembly protein 1
MRLVAKDFALDVESSMEQIPPPVPPAPKPNWWNRNWKWFVPLGCFSIAMLFVVFIGSTVLIVFSAMKSSDIYKDALARAKTHPAVIEALGSPVTEGFLLSGNTNVNGTSGEANLSIPVAGPKGKEQFTWRQRSRLAGGTIPVSSWKSKERINGSIFSNGRRRRVRPDPFS